MTIHERRGLATHGLRGVTGRGNRRLAVSTQGVRGYISLILTSVIGLKATIIGIFYKAEILKQERS